MYDAKLPKIMSPKKIDLQRFGQQNDGGYLACPLDILKSDILISMGINDDCSFETEVHDFNENILIYCFDVSTGFRPLIYRACKQIVSKNPIFNIIRALNKAMLFQRLMAKKRVTFEPLFVGEYFGDEFCALSKILNKYPNNKIFLKIDIEGNEYRILDTLINYRDQLTGLVIEFHDVDLHLATIGSFISKSGLKVVHTHVNNYGWITTDCVPTSIEMTFSSSETADGHGLVPHPFDMPNNKQRPDVKIDFIDSL